MTAGHVSCRSAPVDVINCSPVKHSETKTTETATSFSSAVSLSPSNHCNHVVCLGLDITLLCLHSHVFAVRHATVKQKPAQGRALWVGVSVT